MNLLPIAGGAAAGAAALTGGVYLHFYDNDGDSGRWSPQWGNHRPRASRCELLLAPAHMTCVFRPPLLQK